MDHFEEYTLVCDNARDVRFVGELLAHVKNSGDRNDTERFSGSDMQWNELSLYMTRGGKYVCHWVGRTLKRRHYDRFNVKVCDTIEEVTKFFGHRWLAKELYFKAGITDATFVE